MTVLPEEADTSGDPAPVPCKRKRLSLKVNPSKAKTSTKMDPMASFTAFGTSAKLTPNSSNKIEKVATIHEDNLLPSGQNVLSPSRKVKATPIASLANLGNTCYLNSVLYTLRFSPNFMHNMHHMMEQLGHQTPPTDEIVTREQKIHSACERLHSLFTNLRGNEDVKNSRSQPVQPSVFLSSFRDLNPSFESHQQHDAHELLVCLLDIIRDASTQLVGKKTEPAVSKSVLTSSPKPTAKKSPWCKKKKSKLKLEPTKEEASSSTSTKPKFEQDFIKNFEGVMVSRTICMECESFTERKENFLDICIPLNRTDDKISDEEAERHPSKLYRSQLLTSENISGQNNKYWCDVCRHHNEVKRCTSYESLPNLLMLQMKRFSTNTSSMFSMSKVHDYMPAPMELECFCESCPAESPKPEHTYQLYAVIMHLGITMASGHYVAFVRANSSQQGYFDCNIHQAAQAATAGAAPAPPTGGILKFLKKTERPSVCSLGANACPSTDCCGVKVLMPEEREQEDEPQWLECDDDHVRLLSENEFVELLAPAKSKTLSPYILFYSRKSQAR